MRTPMKNIYSLVFILALIISTLTQVSAQQIPILNHYFTNKAFFYPSAASLGEDKQLSLVYRTGQSGLEGQPATLAVNYNSRLKNRFGHSLTLNSVKAGLVSQQELNVGFGKVLMSKNDHHFSLGVEASLSVYSLNQSLLNAALAADPILLSMQENGLTLAIQSAASYRFRKLALDFLLPHVYNEAINGDNWGDFDAVDMPDFMVGVSYELTLSELKQISLTPNITVRHFHDLETELDVLVRLSYKNKVNIFGGIRSKYGAAIGLGYFIKPNIQLSYNYDLGRSDVPFLSNGASEVGIHFTFDHKERSSGVDRNTRGALVRDSVDTHNITSPNFLSEDDRTALNYFFYMSEPEKPKRTRSERAIQSFDQLFDRQRQEEAARIQAQIDHEKTRQDSINSVKAEEVKLTELAKIEEQAKLEKEANAKKQQQPEKEDLRPISAEKAEEIQKVLSLATDRISFSTNRTEIRLSSIPALNEVFDLLKANPSVRLSLSGYTDNTGKEEDNLRLSRLRAEEVKRYLVGKGVAEHRITAQGFGSANPRSNNNFDWGRALNRRVELKIIQD